MKHHHRYNPDVAWTLSGCEGDMEAATVARMPKKRKAPAGAEPPKGTAAVRVESDLARMIAVIAAVSGEAASDIISPILRPAVGRRYRDVARQLGREVEEGEK